MEYTIRSMNETDASSVMSIFNHYAENDFASWFDQPLPVQAFGRFQEMARNYPAIVVCDGNHEVIGFAFLHAYHPAPTMQRTAEIAYFIHHEHVRKGLGKLMLDKLVAEAIKFGVDNMAAWKSTTTFRNERSRNSYWVAKITCFSGVPTRPNTRRSSCRCCRVRGGMA